MAELAPHHLAELLRFARQIADDDDRDNYFRAVAAALRAIGHLTDEDVALVVRLAFRRYDIRAEQMQ